MSGVVKKTDSYYEKAMNVLFKDRLPQGVDCQSLTVNDLLGTKERIVNKPMKRGMNYTLVNGVKFVNEDIDQLFKTHGTLYYIKNSPRGKKTRSAYLTNSDLSIIVDCSHAPYGDHYIDVRYKADK